MNDELPEGWAPTTLGVVADVNPRHPRDLDDDLMVTFVPMPVVSETDWKLNATQERPFGEVRTGYTQFADGDVLFGKITPCMENGKAAIATNLRNGLGCGTTELHVLRPRPGIDPKYLYHFIHQESFRREAKNNFTGTAGQLRVPVDFMRGAQIPLAPTPEQRRIVAQVELLLAKVRSSQERLDKIPPILKRFRQSVLAAACNGKLTADWRQANPDTKPIAAVIEKLQSGTAGVRVRRGVPESGQQSEAVADWELPETWGVYSAAELLRCGAFIDLKDGNHGANHPKVSEFTPDGLPFITAAQVNKFRIDYAGAYKISGRPLAKIRIGFAKPGDVIYTHKGSVGRVAIADRDCILTPQTTYYRLSPEVFVSGFVMYYLASQYFSGQVNVVKEQTTRDFVPISEQYVLFHLVPPLSEQKEIGRRVEALFAYADKIDARYKKACTAAGRLSQSVLAKAFRGELVPTEAELARREGRRYETAEELLARIKGETNHHAVAKKLKGKVRTSNTK